MLSQSPELETAETRFRSAFNRLKDGTPTVLKVGAPVTQNNVAREAQCDPSALRKTRFPALIREIKAYVEIHKSGESTSKSVVEKRQANRSLEQRLRDAQLQRDQSQSKLASAERRIVELTEKIRSLERSLDEVNPPPTKLGKR